MAAQRQRGDEGLLERPLSTCASDMLSQIIASPSVDYEGLIVANLPLVDSVVRTIARRHWLSADETEELGGAIRLKLVENDYEVLRKFEGRSQLRTYLTVVVQRHFLDERNARWGKWRPSAQAKRLGPIATLLDQLLTRDHLLFDEAVDAVISRHGAAISRAELHAIMLQLPARSSRQFVGEESLEHIPSPDPGEEGAIASLEQPRLGDKIQRALTTILGRLGEEDRAIVRLRFCENAKLARIAEMLNQPAKPFYRRVDDLMARLREELEIQGVSSADVAAIIGDPAAGFDDVIERSVAGKGPERPSVP